MAVMDNTVTDPVTDNTVTDPVTDNTKQAC